MIARCIAVGILLGACGGPATPAVAPPQSVTVAPAASSSASAPSIAASATVPPTGDVDWVAQLPGGELFSAPGQTLPFPLAAVKACHTRGRDAQPNEAGWQIVRVVFAAGHFSSVSTVDSLGLAKSTLDCVEGALNASARADSAYADPRPTSLVLYVAMK